MTPAGTSNELDVQNEWEENTHTEQYNGALLPDIILLTLNDSIGEPFFRVFVPTANNVPT